MSPSITLTTDERKALLAHLRCSPTPDLRLRAHIDTLSDADHRKLAPRLNEPTADVAAIPGATTDANAARWLLDRFTAFWGRLSPAERAALAPELQQLTALDRTA